MSGIYVHIPFCKQACSYCDFYFTTHTLDKGKFIEALIKEIKLRKTYLSQPIQTLYFGGGTPSVLTTVELEEILNTIRSIYALKQVTEITLEANPDNLSFEYLKALKRIGINRLSIGIQSFDDKDLALMNRAHTSIHAIDCFSYARKAGFNNISIDLIYGLPASSLNSWKANIEKALALNPEHISAYNLTIEDGTPLAYAVKKGRIVLPNDELVAQQHSILIKMLKEKGYEHYETSNFCKPGHRSKHNSSYWKNSHYIGLGPSAHSFNGSTRSWNVSNTRNYIQLISTNKNHYETEVLTLIDRINERILTGLRTKEGINLHQFEIDFGSVRLKELLKNASLNTQSNHLDLSNDYLKVSEKGKILLDKITSDLFIV